MLIWGVKLGNWMYVVLLNTVGQAYLYAYWKVNNTVFKFNQFSFDVGQPISWFYVHSIMYKNVY